MAAAHKNFRGTAVGIDFDAVFAGLAQGKGEVRRVDFEYLVGVKPAHAHIQSALRQLQLGDTVVEIENRYTRVGMHANHCAADLDFGAPARIRPQAVAAGQWSIDARLHPIIFAGRRETDRAGHVAQACHARRRIGVGPAAKGG